MAPAVERLNRPTRTGLVLLALALAAVLGIARGLEPDPRGHGTHTQLGLPPCAFATMTGRRCPACGLTTAFAWVVRGRFDRAAAANPAGVLLALGCVAGIPWLLASAHRGRPAWGARTVDGPLVVLIVATGTLGLAAWTFGLILGRA